MKFSFNEIFSEIYSLKSLFSSIFSSLSQSGFGGYFELQAPKVRAYTLAGGLFSICVGF